MGEDVARGQLTKGSSLWGFPASPTNEQPSYKAIKRGRIIVVDYRALNRVTERRYFIIPTADGCSRRWQGAAASACEI